ncbi:MAG: glutamyl-Q tRNA(Asp) synthetase [Halieaceae bacterium]|jgi:glutamyl-Q tRNA(Asp) synthetase
MEDIDPPREEPGAADAILRSLEAHGLHWDESVLWQHSRLEAYAEVTNSLLQSGAAFRCDCRRKDLASIGGPYPGTCRNRELPTANSHAVRLKVDADCDIQFEDVFQGDFTQSLTAVSGDFIIRRRDKLPAYQLAVAIDDQFQNITTVMRGADLLDSTPRQIHVMGALGAAVPEYAHHAVLTNIEGQKLSKQTHAPILNHDSVIANLKFALQFLAQEQPTEIDLDTEELLQWAVAHWHRSAVPRVLSLPYQHNSLNV